MTPADLTAARALRQDVRASPEYLRLLVALWNVVWKQVWHTAPAAWRCRICNVYAEDRATVTHAAGCVLAGHSADELRALDSFEIADGETL